MAKHTPGPWEISHEPPRWIIQAEHGIGKRAVCFMVGDFLECSANARLIEAAPALLAQHESSIVDLEFLRRAIEENDQKAELLLRVDDILRRSREAISKAQG